MSTLKTNWLRTSIILSFFLLIGTFFVVKAMEKKEVVAASTAWHFTENDAADAGAAATTQTYHYLLDDPSGENNPMNWAEGPSESDCDGTEVLCSITAPIGSNGRPDFSTITNVRTSPLITDREFKE